MTSVLYDVPGPRARIRNAIITVVFGLALVAALWWVLDELASKGELNGDKWAPFLRGDVWTTYLLPALGQTLKAAALSLAIALPLGVLLALGRLSDHAWLRWPATVIVEFFRAIPVLLLMVFSKALYVLAGVGSVTSRDLIAVVTALVLYNSSVLAEIFRSGILALPRGQTEASLAIGLRKAQMMRMILLPQAFSAMLPAIVSQLVIIVKDTALGGQLTLAYPELLRTARTITGNFGNVVATYVVIAAIYVVLNFLLSQLAGTLERWLRRRRRGQGRRARPGGGRPASPMGPMGAGVAESAAPGLEVAGADVTLPGGGGAATDRDPPPRTSR
ncbi:MAG TPA: amino acid ABC transporter permease [Nakamurella sp.]|nr:amino acid ABC transporter permease [Nakamurella sp.]